ncbi:FAD/NAD(P)-binding protein [Mucilaginibacter sp. 21P]|uniref:FAD/NAD(P)-binding protein n=1 Tax=Mucilaginibacter sp. 21P TaxID=2778902 RepID=UPI001C597B27|nr:FAD/NAD(P)-binding protein [Mucilaginibacter sp. 21P]QXV64302.1 FAD/NAD(P)-binding protein [Mucilaginibacter sp. 21P]
MKIIKQIAILGGGPSSLFVFKRLVESGHTDISITVFEKNQQLGAGMPYSHDGANDEHVTNVSGNEIPEIVTGISDWVKTISKDTLDKYHINPSKFNDYKVLPRLLFGQYLNAQFKLLLQQAKDKQIKHEVRYGCCVTDIIDHPEQEMVTVVVNNDEKLVFDTVVICTGHNWPKKDEEKIPGFFDSPYPPKKLALKLDHPVAVKGSSLTAIDAIRTLSRHNGAYGKGENGLITYKLNPDSEGFRIVMHSRNGLLPAVRFHLEDPHLSKTDTLTPEQIKAHREGNSGFLSLDYVFEHDFKLPLKKKRPAFYDEIKDMNMEQFVDKMMSLRESMDPFKLLKIEYDEAEASIEQRRSVYWKEMLAILSFAMNYPAKYFSAEDMLRLQKTLMPLISVVIAFIPQSSVEELMALHNAGLLDLISVGDDSYVEPGTEGATYYYTDDKGKKNKQYYKTYVDATGQKHLNFEQFPFASLRENRVITPARVKFKSSDEGLQAMNDGNDKAQTDGKGNYYLNVPGITINDTFEAIDDYGALNDRIYVMSVPYIGGFNPDYSGLDFGEAASEIIVKSIFKDEPATIY